ncbi:MAG: glycoside hydrolase family 16 protein [Bacteroidales bacterium]|jgi:beta-glucanase (GH16 family)|nr:glycoside hydrolase family 16 protein [Bacteroidales bacterium]
MKKLSILISAFLITSTSAFAQDAYRLKWADEFDYTGLPATEFWGYDLGDHGWGNNEMQNYTSQLRNAEVKDGKLLIRAIKEDGKWTSARLVTKNKVDFLYGRLEVRAKLPTGIGTWPAIWMLSTDWEYGGWPESGEIDIMEHVGHNPTVVHATVHTKAYNHVEGTQVGTKINVPDYATQFHTYSVEWTADKIDVFIDDQKYFTFNNDKAGDFKTWPFDKRFHLILNIAMGGNWGGEKGIDPALSEAVMEIDYVRLYTK